VQGNDVARREDMEASECGFRRYMTSMTEVTWSGIGRHMSGGKRGDVTAGREQARE
jgi:hypothetical protein